MKAKLPQKFLLMMTANLFLNWQNVHANDKVRVVTSLPDLKSIAEFVGGDKVEAFAIATGFQNPHFVDPKPSYILKLTKANMFVTVGLDLETGWVPPLLNSARNASINKGGPGYVDASLHVPLLQVPASVNRAEGDIHIFGNPHYWLDPANGKIIAQNICDCLVRIDPANRAYFQENLQKFNARVDAKLKDWVAAMLPFKGTKVIAYHNEWPYFEQRFGLVIADFLEPKPGIPPTPSQLAKVINTMKRDHIKVIINSPYFAAQSAELVASNTGGKVVTLATSVGAEESIKTYFDLFDHNVAMMVEALK
ncbi:zinc ABC transporter substrate-binding protein [candidate division KSB1 bacterium]|nr:zinc ABC transporter substrate-binding protein [candidate division KSB1 bacterium]